MSEAHTEDTTVARDELELEVPAPARGSELGRFLVLEVLGAGGMGVVVSAYDPDLDRKVALKLLRRGPWRQSHGLSESSLVREAQAMARLAHPNVVAVHEVGFHEGQAFVVMEYVDGRTLRQVMREDRPSWREAIALVCAAGDGLAAAHRAGLVHRDIKPENILVGRDGRARVTDFGLVAAVRGPDAVETVDSQAVTGSVQGTPGYMSPEQMNGDPTDARTDQFAFAVTLYEALYGEKPFAGDGYAELLASVCEGRITTPRNDRVPAYVRDALLRALAPKPDARWPSMDALLAHLRSDPRARRRRIAAVAAGVAVVASVGFLIGRTDSGAPAVTCSGGADQIADAWDDADRAQVRAAFLAVGAPYATDTFARVDAALRTRQIGWSNAHRDACEATRVRGDQSEALLDLRMQCLRRARSEMVALVDAFARADAVTLERAVSAATGAGDFETCADTAALSAPVPRPGGAARARKLEEVEAKVATLKAAVDTGRFQEGLAIADEVVTSAGEVGWPPILAEALLYAADLENRAGDREKTIAKLYDAFHSAEAGRADTTKVRALRRLAIIIGKESSHFPEGELLLRIARAAVERAGNGPLLRAELHRAEGGFLLQKQDPSGALVHYQEALDLLEHQLGSDRPELIDALMSAGDALRRLRRLDEARAHLERAVGIAERRLGPEHPQVARSLTMLSALQLDLADTPGAVTSLERALAISERYLPADHPALAPILHNLGNALVSQRRFDDARRMMGRAVAIRSKGYGPRHELTVSSAKEIARIDVKQGRAADALAPLAESMAIMTELFGANDLRVAYVLDVQGAAYLQLGRLREARESYERALRIAIATMGPDYADTGTLVAALARIDLAEGQPARALERTTRALSLIERGFGMDYPDLVEVLLPRVDALIATGDSAGAVAAAERAKAIVAARKLPAYDDGVVRFALARALSARGEQRAAEVAAGEALLLMEGETYAPERERIERWIHGGR